jgi:hypothetical protein
MSKAKEPHELLDEAWAKISHLNNINGALVDALRRIAVEEMRSHYSGRKSASVTLTDIDAIARAALVASGEAHK